MKHILNLQKNIIKKKTMSKIIKTGSDSRVKLLKGVEQLANAVIT